MNAKTETIDCEPEINTRRHVYQMDTLANNNTTILKKPKKKWKIKRKWTNYVQSIVPSIDWLFLNYRWSEDFVEDVIAGITVAVLNLPQGMAYSILANVEPTVGLYMALFPVLVYSLLGTSRHISLGALSTVCMMTGKVVNTYSTDTNVDSTGYSAIQVGTVVSLVAGLIQLFMYVFRLGMLCTILSETLVSGFTSAVAVIVFTSQLNELLGTKSLKRRGIMSVLYTYYDLVGNLDTINWVTTTVSLTTIAVLLIYNKFFRDKINNKLCMPLPIEMLVTIFSTVLFQATTIAEDNNMVQIGEIKSGLPDFEVPPLKLIPEIFVDANVIALVAYSITMSLALLMSEKHKYRLDTNQELLAQGFGNVVGSFFSCLPCGASPSRSASQESVGGKTQMASIVSAAIIVVVLLWVGVVFEPLPRCVLSSIIVVALKGILLQVTQLPNIWRNSKSDVVIWITTYVTVIALDIDVGLLAGVMISLLFVFIKGVLNDVHVLGRLPNTDLYMRLDLYSNAVEISGVKILRYTGSLNVINRYMFKRKFIKAVTATGEATIPVTVIGNDKEATYSADPSCVIVDMAALQYTDSSGVKLLCELIESLTADKYEIYLVAVPDNSLYYMRSNGLKCVRLFPTLHDAVVFRQCTKNLKNTKIGLQAVCHD